MGGFSLLMAHCIVSIPEYTAKGLMKQSCSQSFAISCIFWEFLWKKILFWRLLYRYWKIWMEAWTCLALENQHTFTLHKLLQLYQHGELRWQKGFFAKTFSYRYKTLTQLTLCISWSWQEGRSRKYPITKLFSQRMPPCCSSFCSTRIIYQAINRNAYKAHL